IPGDLLSARAAGFDLSFTTPTRFTDRSRPASPIEAEIRSATLPEDSLADTQVGGWSARWSESPAEASLERIGPGIAVEGSVGGIAARIALDASADGPPRVRPGLARRAGLSDQADVLGRRIARGGPFSVSALSFPRLFFEISDAVPEGADVS